MTKEIKACVVGMGKAGLPLACAMANSGIDVTGLEINKKVVE